MKKIKFSIICLSAMLLGVGGAFANTYYYANTGNVSMPANSDLKSESSNPSSLCNESSEQICAVTSTTAPVGGELPASASYTPIAYGDFQ